MRVAIRADASAAIGLGHVMRCLTLAEALREYVAEVVFLSRDLPGNAHRLVEACGFTLRRLPDVADWSAETDAQVSLDTLPTDMDWLIVDHYRLARDWQQALRARAARILVIDDLADRPHDCDLLLDQNPLAPDRYAGLLPAGCQTLFGLRHALLRRQFAAARVTRRPWAGEVRRLLLFFGGGDAGNETGKVLEALLDGEGVPAFADLEVDVVVGGGNPHRESVQAQCAALARCRFHCQAEDMAGLMVAADLAAGAAGVATWERACLGLPCLAVSVAENQHPIARAAAEAGLLIWLGEADRVGVEQWRQALRRALSAPETLARQSRAGMALVDGLGAGRVVERMRA